MNERSRKKYGIATVLSAEEENFDDWYAETQYRGFNQYLALVSTRCPLSALAGTTKTVTMVGLGSMETRNLRCRSAIGAPEEEQLGGLRFFFFFQEYTTAELLGQ